LQAYIADWDNKNNIQTQLINFPGALMGAIVNIFKAIFGGILGLFAKKETTSGSTVNKIKAKKEKGFYMAAPEVDASAAAPVAAAVAVAIETPAPQTASNGKAAKAGKAPAAKAKKGEAKPVVAVAKKEVFPEPIDLINAALAASKAATEEAQAAVGSFAEQYMMPLPTPTRRPGANMAMYKSMAKDMKRF
jgi:hypothetical protein